MVDRKSATKSGEITPLSSEQITQSLENSLSFLENKSPEMYAFMHTITSNLKTPLNGTTESLYDILLQGNRNRTDESMSPEDISGLPMSIYEALNYACAMEPVIEDQERIDYTSMYGTTSEQQWWEYIQKVLMSPKRREIFTENCWRIFAFNNPGRNVAVKYILSQVFGSDTQIDIVDLGAGLHLQTPSLNTDLYERFRQRQIDQIGEHNPGLRNWIASHNPQAVDITHAVGIDMLSQDLEWVKAAFWPMEANRNPRQELVEVSNAVHTVDPTGKKFPFIKGDMRQARELIDVHIPDLQGKKVQAVVTSFIRTYVGKTEEESFEAIRKIILPILDVGGIWIDMGGDMQKQGATAPADGYTQPETSLVGVHVYQLTEDGLLEIAVPFKLAGQYRIYEVNENEWDKLSTIRPTKNSSTRS